MADIMTKAEFYANIIDITKKTGQGLSDIVCKAEHAYQIYCDELVEEGLIVPMEQQYTHLPNSIFYMPSKGYNVWKDIDPKVLGAGPLAYVRLYVGATEDISFGAQNGELVRS
jgi:hypothetical protein